MTKLTSFLVLSFLFRPPFFPMSSLCFAQINSRSSCFEERSCGKPDLLRINFCSCTDPIRWLRFHLRKWLSMLLLHSENFVNLNVVSLQNDPPLVSNIHLFAIIAVFLKLSLNDGLAWQADFNGDVLSGRLSISKCGCGVELCSLTRNSGKSCAQVSNAIPTYSLKVSFNSVIKKLVKWLKLEINPSCEAGKLYLWSNKSILL